MRISGRATVVEAALPRRVQDVRIEAKAVSFAPVTVRSSGTASAGLREWAMQATAEARPDHPALRARVRRLVRRVQRHRKGSGAAIEAQAALVRAIAEAATLGLLEAVSPGFEPDPSITFVEVKP